MQPNPSAAPPDSLPPLLPISRAKGWSLIVLYGVLLVAVLPTIASVWPSVATEAFNAFYQAGALVFGGGHVVLPLLQASVVPPGWVTDAQFLTGYAAAQAVPGPLFTLAAYLGACHQQKRRQKDGDQHEQTTAPARPWRRAAGVGRG